MGVGEGEAHTRLGDLRILFSGKRRMLRLGGREDIVRGGIGGVKKRKGTSGTLHFFHFFFIPAVENYVEHDILLHSKTEKSS